MRAPRIIVAVALVFVGLALVVQSPATAQAECTEENFTSHSLGPITADSSSPTGYSITATFTTNKDCERVSFTSWNAPDANAGQPQTKVDEIREELLPAGSYTWTIDSLPPNCFFQIDLHIPGDNLDVLLGGTEKCLEVVATTTTTTTSPSTTSTPTTTTTEAAPTTTTSTIVAQTLVPPETPEGTVPEEQPAPGQPELAKTGRNELALTTGGAGMIVAGVLLLTLRRQRVKQLAKR